MTIYTGNAETRPMQGVTSLQSSLGEELGATAGEAFANAPSVEMERSGELSNAAGHPEFMPGLDPAEIEALRDMGRAAPALAVPMEEAHARVKAAGLSLNLGNQDSIPQDALDIMINRARDERERQATIARGAGGFIHGALDVGTSVFVGALDPLNLAAFALPVAGEVRYGRMLADTGSAFLPRAGLGLAVGAEKGALGTLALSPLEALARTQQGADYSMNDTLRSMMYGAATMGALHAAGGEGARLYKQYFPDLPPRAAEDVLHGSAARLIEGRPVQAEQHLAAAAEIDPRIAESVGATPTTLSPEATPTGRPQVDAVLAEPRVARAIASPTIDREHDVPYEAGASNEPDDLTTHIDRRIPAQVTISGKAFDPAIPANIHEQVEREAMERLIATKKAEVGREPTQVELNQIYEIAHHEYAEPAEDAWYRAHDINVDEVNKWWEAQDRTTEGENPTNPPPDLYTKPYPHSKVEGARHEETGVAAEWPTEAGVEPPAQRRQQSPEKNWRDLSATRAPHDEPEALAASTAAEKLPEPPSLDPKSSRAAAEKAAQEAEEEYKAAAQYLTDEEREKFDAPLRELDEAHAAWQSVLKQGAACLAAAVL